MAVAVLFVDNAHAGLSIGANAPCPAIWHVNGMGLQACVGNKMVPTGRGRD